MRVATILWALLAAAAGTSLFMLKYEVQSQEQRLSSLHKDIVEAKESIHVLKAEWSYLNDPSRLREQAERHLGLHPLKPSQIVTIASLPMNDGPSSQPPLAQSQIAPQPVPAPVVTIPPAPTVTRKAPGATAKGTPAPVPSPAKALPKPARSMTATKGVPTSAVKTAAHKPPVKTTTVATAKPVPSPRPSYANAPESVGTANTAANVMVIKSPALSDPEVASTRARP
jgi:hypothetical protein